MPLALSNSRTSCHCVGHSYCINDRSNTFLNQSLGVEGGSWEYRDRHIHELGEELTVEVIRFSAIRSCEDRLENIGLEALG